MYIVSLFMYCSYKDQFMSLERPRGSVPAPQNGIQTAQHMLLHTIQEAGQLGGGPQDSPAHGSPPPTAM